MAVIFGRPIVCTNISAAFSFSATGAPNQIGIPKLPRYKETNELVPWPIFYSTRASENRVSFELEKLYVLQENTPGEILEVVEEMLLWLSGNFAVAGEDEELQQRLRALIPPDSMTYGTASRCGTAFLRRYAHLLEG